MITPDLLLIPCGSFLMGENDNDKFSGDTERPRHRVTLPAFRLGRGPVTLGEFRVFHPGHEEELPADWPAAGMSWQEAAAYCQWLTRGLGEPSPPYRLPSEA